jgi:DNA-directed RNA polymerase specialized sigma24 family protein
MFAVFDRANIYQKLTYTKKDTDLPKFRTVLNKEVEANYLRWRNLSRRLTRDNTTGDDLLHTVLARILSSESIDGVISRGTLRQYVDRSLYLSYHSKTSDFHRQYRTPDKASDIPTPETTSAPDLGALINSENINAAIQRLPELDRILIQLYKDADFSYQDVALATGIPILYLRKRIHIIHEKIRTHVHCSTRGIGQEVIYLPRV